MPNAKSPTVAELQVLTAAAQGPDDPILSLPSADPADAGLATMRKPPRFLRSI
jgi:hypothetical protein